MTAASFSVAQTPDAGATNLPTGYIHTFRRSVLFASSHTSPDMVCPSAHTPSFARLRTWAHLRWRAHLRRRRPARTNQTTFKWPRANKLRTDGPAAPTPHSRGLNTWRPQRFVTMSRLSARYAQLIRMCRRRGCSPEDAKDLVQEAHRRWFDYQQTTKVRDVDALLRRILLNLSISHYRELTSPFTFESAERLDRRGLLVDPASAPERMVAAEQELNSVVNLLSAVSPRTCQIFIAHRGGYSYKEIGAAYAIKPRTVEKHVASARLILTEMMPGSFASL